MFKVRRSSFELTEKESAIYFALLGLFDLYCILASFIGAADGKLLFIGIDPDIDIFRSIH